MSVVSALCRLGHAALRRATGHHMARREQITARPQVRRATEDGRRRRLDRIIANGDISIKPDGANPNCRIDICITPATSPRTLRPGWLRTPAPSIDNTISLSYLSRENLRQLRQDLREIELGCDMLDIMRQMPLRRQPSRYTVITDQGCDALP